MWADFLGELRPGLSEGQKPGSLPEHGKTKCLITDIVSQTIFLDLWLQNGVYNIKLYLVSDVLREDLRDDCCCDGTIAPAVCQAHDEEHGNFDDCSGLVSVPHVRTIDDFSSKKDFRRTHALSG